jgi:hypothetical protein
MKTILIQLDPIGGAYQARLERECGKVCFVHLPNKLTRTFDRLRVKRSQVVTDNVIPQNQGVYRRAEIERWGMTPDPKRPVGCAEVTHRKIVASATAAAEACDAKVVAAIVGVRIHNASIVQALASVGIDPCKVLISIPDDDDQASEIIDTLIKSRAVDLIIEIKAVV